MIYGGDSLGKIHSNLPDPSSGDVFVKAKTKQTQCFSPKKNIDCFIYQCREIVQGDNKPFLTLLIVWERGSKALWVPRYGQRGEKTDNSEEFRQERQAESSGKRTYIWRDIEHWFSWQKKPKGKTGIWRKQLVVTRTVYRKLVTGNWIEKELLQGRMKTLIVKGVETVMGLTGTK